MNKLICLILVSVLSLGTLSCAHSVEGKQSKTEDAASKTDSKATAEALMFQATMDANELEAKIARYAPTRIAFDPSLFSEQEVDAILLLVKASLVMDDLFWKQASSNGPRLRTWFSKFSSGIESKLAGYLKINYGAYDRLDDMKPFFAMKTKDGQDLVPPKAPGATFYPEDLKKEEFESWLEKKPADKDLFLSNFSIIRRQDDGLVAIPYSKFYSQELGQAAELLRKAAGLVKNESLAKYLKSRADAFSSNDYYQSDVDWMDVKESLLEVTIGPYEVYEDGLFNNKAAFESFITVRNAQESQKLAKVAKYLTEMEKNLPLPEEHKNLSRGLASPIVVADLILSAGDTRAGVQTLAFNLPNDERVREQKGSKKVMLKNISHAKFDKILTPIAARVLMESQGEHLTFDAYFNHTLMHEVSHGLGPGFLEGKDGKRTTVNLILKDTYVAMEEAKADVLGMYNTLFLIDKGLFPAELKRQCLITFLAGIFRSVRFGVHEAHGQANVILFNFMLENGAYLHDAQTKRFSVSIEKAPEVIKNLANAILLIQAKGDYAGAQAFIAKYGKVDPRMQERVDSLKDIPVDIFPIFEIEQGFGK